MRMASVAIAVCLCNALGIVRALPDSDPSSPSANDILATSLISSKGKTLEDISTRVHELGSGVGVDASKLQKIRGAIEAGRLGEAGRLAVQTPLSVRFHCDFSYIDGLFEVPSTLACGPGTFLPAQVVQWLTVEALVPGDPPALVGQHHTIGISEPGAPATRVVGFSYSHVAAGFVMALDSERTTAVALMPVGAALHVAIESSSPFPVESMFFSHVPLGATRIHPSSTDAYAALIGPSNRLSFAVTGQFQTDSLRKDVTVTSPTGFEYFQAFTGDTSKLFVQVFQPENTVTVSYYADTGANGVIWNSYRIEAYGLRSTTTIDGQFANDAGAILDFHLDNPGSAISFGFSRSATDMNVFAGGIFGGLGNLAVRGHIPSADISYTARAVQETTIWFYSGPGYKVVQHSGKFTSSLGMSDLTYGPNFLAYWGVQLVTLRSNLFAQPNGALKGTISPCTTLCTTPELSQPGTCADVYSSFWLVKNTFCRR